MSKLSSGRRRAAALILTAAALVSGVVLTTTPASAAVLFSDDFEQPTANVWQLASGGNWSVVSEDGSKVFKQSNTTGAPNTYAGSGSGPGTVVTARLKPTSTLGTSNLVAVTGRENNPSS